MRKNDKMITFICSITAIAVTIIFYLLVFDNIFTVPMRWVSLMFLLLAEIIGTVKALKIKKGIFGAANMTVSFIHLGAVLILSIVFVNLFPLFIKKYILLNLLMICILLIVDAILLFSAGHISSSNKKIAESQAVIDSCYIKAQSLSIEYQNSDYGKALSEIAEMLKYSDNSTLTNDEITILDKLDEVQELLANNEPAIERINEIKKLIKLRAIKLTSQKRGDF